VWTNGPIRPMRRTTPSLAWHGSVMSEVTQILSRIQSGDPSAAEQVLPLLYDKLRKLAAAKMAQEKQGQTLQATALAP
jgi:hypothetical protein